MTHESRLFGAFIYDPNEVLTFPQGMLGFAQYTQYVLRETAQTRPLKWLLSIEDGGPELALIDPSVIIPGYNTGALPLQKYTLQDLQAINASELMAYAVVTLPRNIHHMSMNLRNPILINPEQHVGLQYPTPGIGKQQIRRFIYRDLLRSRPEDHPSIVVTLRKRNETVEIGDEITVQVLELADGGVRLGITAPRRVKISRGTYAVTPAEENHRANAEMDLTKLKGIMSVYSVGSAPNTAMAAHHVQENTDVEAAV